MCTDELKKKDMQEKDMYSHLIFEGRHQFTDANCNCGYAKSSDDGFSP